jgi:hypothetical protein
MDCQCLPSCPFFHDKMKNMPAMAEHMKKKYCHSGWSSCARFRVFQARGKAVVPADLFPAQADRASEILAG